MSRLPLTLLAFALAACGQSAPRPEPTPEPAGPRVTGPSTDAPARTPETIAAALDRPALPPEAARASRDDVAARTDGRLDTVRPPEAFAAIADERDRAAALFAEMGKILTHPRCINCHPAGERPLQGQATGVRQRLHLPRVVRGEDGHGVPGLRCASCHGEENYRRVPGAPHWHLAPVSMAWVGRTLPQICAQLKDPARNGGKSMEAMHAHMAEDKLVAYGWDPPAHLEPAPGSQQVLGALFRAWWDAGAHCPR